MHFGFYRWRVSRNEVLVDIMESTWSQFHQRDGVEASLTWWSYFMSLELNLLLSYSDNCHPQMNDSLL